MAALTRSIGFHEALPCLQRICGALGGYRPYAVVPLAGGSRCVLAARATVPELARISKVLMSGHVQPFGLHLAMPSLDSPALSGSSGIGVLVGVVAGVSIYSIELCDGLLYSKECGANDDAKPSDTSSNGGGDIKEVAPPPKDKTPLPPPPPPGNGPSGMGDKDREEFIRLLVELLNQLRRVLDGEGRGQDLPEEIKKDKLDLDVEDLKQTKASVEELLKELKEKDGLLQLTHLVENFGKKLSAMESRLGEEKLPTAVNHEEVKSKGTGAKVLEFYSTVADILDFLKTKFVIGIGVTACYYCGVWPKEGLYLSIQLLKDTIESTRVSINKLQKEVAGTNEDKEQDVGTVLLEEVKEVKEIIVEQSRSIKVLADAEKQRKAKIWPW